MKTTFQVYEKLEKFDLNSSLVENESPTKILQKPRVRNVNRLIIGYKNFNTLRNNFKMLKDCIKGNKVNFKLHDFLHEAFYYMQEKAYHPN